MLGVKSKLNRLFDHVSCVALLKSEENFDILYSYLKLGNQFLISKVFSQNKRNAMSMKTYLDAGAMHS